ncbi:MAG: NAD-dependent epimerase/dehydratase family protein [Tetrasphaera sp.]|nr:NAD-dependent epimerase/dehydratase family protein [Tetrasphaera sp.]
MADVVLITGVSRYLGGAFARALSQVDPARTIVGVDVIPPPHDIGRAEFVRADIRSPMIGKLIEQYAVDTVVHMGVIATPLGAGGRATQKEINVIGTMQLLAACQKAPRVRKLVVKSTAGVYGASHRDPALFTEGMAAKRLPKLGFGKDSVDVEAYVRGFARRRPDVGITTLRLANVIGPRVRTAMTDYFRLPVVPIPLGWDARLQFLHEDDVAAAMIAATLGEPADTVNVAGDGIITVSQAIALAGRPFVTIPTPLSTGLSTIFKRTGLIDFSPEQLDLLVYGRGLDTTRMKTVLGFEPAYSTKAAFEDFVAAAPRPADTALTAIAGAVHDAGSALHSLVGAVPIGRNR